MVSVQMHTACIIYTVVALVLICDLLIRYDMSEALLTRHKDVYLMLCLYFMDDNLNLHTTDQTYLCFFFKRNFVVDPICFHVK